MHAGTGKWAKLVALSPPATQVEAVERHPEPPSGEQVGAGRAFEEVRREHAFTGGKELHHPLAAFILGSKRFA